MHKFLIKCVNCALLVVILIGIPAITRAQFGNLQVASASKSRQLIFAGLIIAAVANVLLALFVKNRKDRILCWEWAAVFGVLAGVEYAVAAGYFNFDWLKKFLLWLRKEV
ncbi:MAG TPA: hypothetical protein VHG71_09840 [Verrucomicrobiae bacterium]|nr:hypothetical protein [Verrucomicrobiae bacterium]